jgi:hypothetical protein
MIENSLTAGGDIVREPKLVKIRVDYLEVSVNPKGSCLGGEA